MECHGGWIMECCDDHKRRARESNVGLQDLEKTTHAQCAAQHVKRTRPDWKMLETGSQKLGQGQRTVYEQAKKLRSRTP